VNAAGRPAARRVWLAPAFVLHQYPYRDTSRIVEAFTGEYGRLTLFARGANGSKSSFKGVLRPFQRMLVSWSGKGEACQLVAAEIDGPATRLAAERLMSGFYLNELLLKLTERRDPHPEIFLSYAACVQALCDGEVEEAALRCFEKRLLIDLGYGLELTRTSDGAPVDRNEHYRFAPQSGLQRCAADAPGAVRGQSLADLQAESFGDARAMRDAKRLLRAAIDACLDGRSLKSREVALALRRREVHEAHEARETHGAGETHEAREAREACEAHEEREAQGECR
jgi:DNA repair protein RecO (recombination protein O)